MNTKAKDKVKRDVIGPVNIISLINNSILKINKPWINIPLIIVTNLILAAFMVGFYVFPFISYYNFALKILFACFWLVGGGLLSSLFISGRTKEKNDLTLKIITIIFLLISFALIFIHNNFISLGNAQTVIIFIVMVFLLITSITALVVIIKTQPKIFLHTLLLFIVGFLLFSLYIGAKNSTYFDESTRNNIVLFSFFAMVCLVLGFILTAFFKSEKLSYIYLYAALIMLGFIIIIAVSYVINYFDPHTRVMEAFVPIFASFVGGGLTLFGVAWTIRHNEEKRKEEEKKKYKPIFTSNRILSEGAGITAKKACFSYSDTGELFICSVTMEIDNADKSAFEIKSVFHDNKWWNIAGDYVVLPNRQVVFYFSFNEDVNNLFMRVQDGIGNQYYYEIKVIAINLFPGHQSNNIYAHTVREIKEITLEEIEKRISDLKKTESKEKADNA